MVIIQDVCRWYLIFGGMDKRAEWRAQDDQKERSTAAGLGRRND